MNSEVEDCQRNHDYVEDFYLPPPHVVLFLLLNGEMVLLEGLCLLLRLLLEFNVVDHIPLQPIAFDTFGVVNVILGHQPIGFYFEGPHINTDFAHAVILVSEFSI